MECKQRNRLAAALMEIWTATNAFSSGPVISKAHYQNRVHNEWIIPPARRSRSKQRARDLNGGRQAAAALSIKFCQSSSQIVWYVPLNKKNIMKRRHLKGAVHPNIKVRPLNYFTVKQHHRILQQFTFLADCSFKIFLYSLTTFQTFILNPSVSTSVYKPNL